MATLTAKILADFTTALSTALAVGGTSATLQSATDDDGIALVSGRYFFTIDGSNSSKEHISCSLASTALTSIKSVSRQGVETSGVVRSHRIGATVTLTDFAHIKVINDLVSGATTFDASVPLGYDGTATLTTANQFGTKAYIDGIAIAGSPDATTTTKGIGRVSTAPVAPATPIFVGDNDTRVPTQNENDALVGTSGTATSGSNKLVDADDVSAAGVSGKIVRLSGTSYPAGNGSAITGLPGIVFGGTGADGALSSSSGTTTLDAVGSRFLLKQYTSVSLTGTAVLTISNPHANGTVLIILSQGAVTMTSSASPAIDFRNMGGTGGIGVSNQDGTKGNNGTGIGQDTEGGFPGAEGGNGSGTLYQGSNGFMMSGINLRGNISIACGAGGGGGGSSANESSTGGAGGRGGGALYVECGGALNISAIFNFSGTAGSTGASSSGGGGGGGGGAILFVYNTLTANTATFTVTAGSGGGTSTGGASTGGGGGGGGASAGGSKRDRTGGSSGFTGDAGVAGQDGASLVLQTISTA